ncbi:MAG: hypothetical protein VB087_02610, partial [Candidatus Limiplasma sp.]|nr:hypothetical protein [Candidatus Limiplasma sp.]
GQAAACGCGWLAARIVIWLRKSGNIICRRLLGVRAPTNVRKILDVTECLVSAHYSFLLKSRVKPVTPDLQHFPHTPKTTYR